MSRFWMSAAILILSGCGEAPEEPPRVQPPADPPLVSPPHPLAWVQIGTYRVDGSSEPWTLSRSSDALEQVLLRSIRGLSGTAVRSFDLSEGRKKRFRLVETAEGLQIQSWVPEYAFLAFAQLPLKLPRSGSWSYYRNTPPSAPGARMDTVFGTASCRRDTHRTLESDEDPYRVDFKEGDQLRHSMWFTRKEGLIRWAGMDMKTMEREPDSRRLAEVWEAATGYQAWGRVDDDPRWAPPDCAGPIEPPLRMSASRESDSHGRKLYYLFAKDRVSYLRADDFDQPEGQIIVKESWIPGGREQKGPVFLMLKSRGEWTYATTTPDGTKVTSAGRVESCIRCHESPSTRDRMFGLQPASGHYTLGDSPSSDN